MLKEKKKEMIEYANLEITKFVEALPKKIEQKKANNNKGVMFALGFCIKFDETGKFTKLEKTSSSDYLKKCAYEKEGCIDPGDNLDAYIYNERIEYLKSSGVDVAGIGEEDICRLCPSKSYCENCFDPKCMYFRFIQDDVDE